MQKEIRIYSDKYKVKSDKKPHGRIFCLVRRGLVKAKIVWSSVGFNNRETILRGSFQQSVLVNKVSASLAIVLTVRPASMLYLFQGSFSTICRLVWTLWALTTNSQQPHPVSKHPGNNLGRMGLRSTKQSRTLKDWKVGLNQKGPLKAGQGKTQLFCRRM